MIEKKRKKKPRSSVSLNDSDSLARVLISKHIWSLDPVRLILHEWGNWCQRRRKNQHGLGFWFWHMYFSWACGHQSLPGKLWCFTSSLMKIFRLCLFTHPIPSKDVNKCHLLSVLVHHAGRLTAYGFNERHVSSWARISALSLSWLRAQMNIAWLVWI